MSRSRRAPEPTPTPLHKRSRRIRPWLLTAGKAALWILLTLILRLGLSRGLNALFAAWNVSMDTLSRAPGLARTLYLWQGSIVSLIVSVLGIALIVGLLRVPLPPLRLKVAGRWWLIGTGLAVVLAAVFLVIDSLRLNWPLTAPKLSFGLFILWLLSLLTVLSEELFLRSLLQTGLKTPWGIAAAALVFFLMNGGYSGTVISGVNVTLLGAVCGLIFSRYGLWADAAFRWGWSFASVFLLGQGGGAHSVYRLYGVSEGLLTGGDAGFVYGLGLTAALILLGGALILPRQNKSGDEGIAPAAHNRVQP